MSLLNRVSMILGLFLVVHSLPVFAVESGKVDTPIMFSCNVSFSAKGTSAYIVLGYTNIKGSGAINCYDYVKKVVQRIPIDVVVKGPGLGLGVTGVNISGIGAGIGLNESPEALLGTYLAVRGNAAVGLGGAVGANLRVAKGSFNIGLSIEGGSGLGAGVDLLTVELKRSRKPQILPPKAKEAIQVTDLNIEKNEITVKVGQKIRIVDEKGQTVKVLRVRRK